MKWAESSNGKIAGPGGKRSQISSDRAMKVVHELRARSDTILVGINTAITDDPQLTVRNVETFRPLHRAVLDTNLRLPMELVLARTGAGEVVVFCSKETFRTSSRVAELEAVGLQVRAIRSTSAGRLSLDDMLYHLDEYGQHLLIESGPTLARSFFDENQCDRVWVIRSPNPIDHPDAPQAASVPGDYIKTGEVSLGGDVLSEYLNPRSAAFFSATPSADLVRLQG
jgi:diaminohydroxyphosphoribosylaminopyrimidine deaminase/5-amino-6-(5-phosphoribosylamino)uracil reductase